MKYFTPLLFIVFAFTLTGEEGKWKAELEKRCPKAKTGVTVEANAAVASNSKMKLKSNDMILTISESVYMCDFLIGKTNSVKYAFCKFSYNSNGAMAYVVEERISDPTSTGSEFKRYVLITLNKEREWVDQKVLAQQGQFFFRSSEAGSCAQTEGANALRVEHKGSFTINADNTLTVKTYTKQDDVDVDAKNKIRKTLNAGEWSEVLNTSIVIEPEGTIAVKE
ncbi:MAG TPA: hypothetical protein VK177_19835 [Flavobacteriales bacterium]|nr:hypothetical protein [Flavobacteriales bacterium]